MFAKRATVVLVSLACATLGCNGNTTLTQAPTNTEPPLSEFPTELTINPGAIPPADVLEQIDFTVPAAALLSCIKGPTAVNDPVPIGQPIKWCFCEIKDGQTFTVGLIDPNGVVVKQADFKAYISDFQPCEEGSFPPNLLLPGVPLGLYTLEFTTPQSKIIMPFTLTPANKPTILKTETGYILTGFRPGEKVRLLAYKGDKFAGEWWRQTDQNGEFRFKVDSPVFLYAVGVQSGEALRGGDYTFSMLWINYAGPLDYAASIEPTGELPLYEVPSNQNPAVATLPPGTRLRTTSWRPFSNNGTYWWQVESETGTQGWADERLLKLVNYEPNDTLEQTADLFRFDTGANSYRYSKLPLQPADRDFYRVQLKAGTITVSIFSRGEKTFPTPVGMVLYDNSGVILGEKSAPALDIYHDLYLILTVPKDGAYYVEVYDNGIAQPIDYTLSIR